MTKPFGLLLTLLAFVLLNPATAKTQIYYPPYPYPHPPHHRPDPNPHPSPVEVGGYVAAGGGSVAIGAVGLYSQWNRTGFCPGLDLRLQGNTGNLHGALVGPRLAYQSKGQFRDFHPYVEALFGPNEFPRPSTPGIAFPPSYRGVTSAAIIGVDLDSNEVFRWRVIEFSRETFSGLAGVSPYTITTGIVLHLP